MIFNKDIPFFQYQKIDNVMEVILCNLHNYSLPLKDIAHIR